MSFLSLLMTKISKVMKLSGFLILLTDEFSRYLYQYDRDKAKVNLLTD
jgi:hypothetical protein